MTIDEIIHTAADMCNIELGSRQTDPRYVRLKSAVEYAIVESVRVLKKKKEETVSVVNGLISYNAFSMGVVELIAVRKNKLRIKWVETQDGFYIGDYNGTVQAEYVPCPLTMTGQDTPPVAEQVFSHRNYAYFAASEFLTGEARHTDARSFYTRWEHALYRAGGRRRMPLRGWL